MSDWWQIVEFLAAPAVLCFILIGIHCYLGLHVLERQVIFIDLSLAQVAALGSVAGVLVGFESGGWANYGISLSATFAAAYLFTKARAVENRISQEALIGIVYAFGAAMVVILLNSFSHGAEDIKAMLVGNILWVSWPEIGKILVIYSIVGIIHYAYRKPFWAATTHKNQDNIKLWDFTFYALFGVVITSSVSVAGILQVFIYLIVPPLLGRLLFKSIRSQLLMGWGTGVLLTLVGLWLSYAFDLPAGAAIVALFALIPILIIGLGYLA